MKIISPAKATIRRFINFRELEGALQDLDDGRPLKEIREAAQAAAAKERVERTVRGHPAVTRNSLTADRKLGRLYKELR